MAARIWSNNCDITNLLKNYKFQFLLTAAIFVSICFWYASSLAFLLSLNFLFTRDYYISTRVEIFSIGMKFFGIPSWNFNGDENSCIISPLVRCYFTIRFKVFTSFQKQLIHIRIIFHFFFCCTLNHERIYQSLEKIRMKIIFQDIKFW